VVSAFFIAVIKINLKFSKVHFVNIRYHRG